MTYDAVKKYTQMLLENNHEVLNNEHGVPSVQFDNGSGTYRIISRDNDTMVLVSHVIVPDVSFAVLYGINLPVLRFNSIYHPNTIGGII